MKTTTIQEIRRANLRLLIKEEGTEEEEGTAVALALKCDTTQSYLSQILIRYPTSSGKAREMGTELARKLERGCNKPEGWMDVDHSMDVDADIDPAHSELVHLYATMKPEMRRILIQTARLMVKEKR
jgi:hypothetical protein